MTWKEQLPSPNATEYGGWPLRVSLAEYAEARRQVVDLVTATSKKASLYQVGDVGFPGISDLDFIIVVDGDERGTALDRWGQLAAAFAPVTRYILDPRPLIVDAELWRTLPVLHSLKDLRHLAGPALPVPPAADGEVTVSHLFDLVERRLFVSPKVEKYLLGRSVNVRTALKRCSKIEIQTRLLAAFGVGKPGWSEFNTSVSALRRDWFTLERTAQIRALHPLLIASAEIEAAIIGEISELLARAGMEFPEPGSTGRSTVGAFDYQTVFVKSYQPEFRLDCLAGSHLIRGEWLSVLPATFMLPILIYASRSRAMENVFRDRLTVFGDIPDASLWQLPSGIDDRIRILDRYLAFIRNHGYQWGLFFNMWDFPPLKAGDCRRYWTGSPEHNADILPFLLRKQWRKTFPLPNGFPGRAATELYLRLRLAQKKLNLAGRLRRLSGRLRDAAAQPFPLVRGRS